MNSVPSQYTGVSLSNTKVIHGGTKALGPNAGLDVFTMLGKFDTHLKNVSNTS